MNVEELLAGVPVGFLYAGLVVWALTRSAFYYGSGRLATSRMSDDGKAAQVRATVARHGARSVLVAWPVPGLSAATQIANGAARVPVRHVAAVVYLASRHRRASPPRGAQHTLGTDHMLVATVQNVDTA